MKGQETNKITFKMIKASDLKEGSLIVSNKGHIYQVVTNHVGDVLYLVTEDVVWYSGVHLFYEDEIDKEDALNVFGIILE